MGHWRKVVAGVVGGLLALAALAYTANATSSGTYYGGLLIFVIGVLFVFLQIKRGFDQADAARHTSATEAETASEAPATAKPASAVTRATNGSGQPAAAASDPADSRATREASGARAGQANGSGAKR